VSQPGHICRAGQFLPGFVYRWLTISGEVRWHRRRSTTVIRISGPNANAAIANAPAARRSAGGAFTVSEEETPRAAAGPVALRTVGGIDALIALQGLEGPTERRKQAVRRGRVALDALGELKLALLDGSLSQATLSKLKSAAGVLKAGSGDDRLDGVLGEIELRVEVEIAKMAVR
jgi:hypothetical protein